MERNVQVIKTEKNRRAAWAVLSAFLMLCLSLGLFGCGKKEALPDEYELETRIAEFAVSDEPADVAPFARDLCVLLSEDSSDSSVTAQAAAVFDLEGGSAVFQKNALARMNPASTTKVMTALLAIKYGNPDDLVTVTDAVLITEAGSTMCGIKPGDVITMEQLLYGLLMPSGNDAANAIAVHMDGSIEAFTERMNREAKLLGATGTHFANANGLTDPDHYTTAYDLYLIFHEALKYDAFRQIIGTGAYTAEYVDGEGKPKTSSWKIGNLYMKGDRSTPDGLTVFGGKTGTTKAAGYCLIMGSSTDDGHEYASVVMKADSRAALYDNMTKIISKIGN